MPTGESEWMIARAPACSRRAAFSRTSSKASALKPHQSAQIEEAVPADVLSAALYTRFRSRQEHTFAEKILSAMREKFGGHVEKPSTDKAA